MRRRVVAWCVALCVRLLCRLALRVVGVRVALRGAVPRGGALLVANHLSWIDIVAVLAHVDCVFVAKREVATWPVVGWMARVMGVVFVDRARKRDLLRAVPALASSLASGRRVLLFAEGTTTDGRVLLPFRSALVEAAVIARVPVVPIALTASCEAGDASALCWIGDETLVENLPRVHALRRPRMVVHAAGAIAVGDVCVGRLGLRKALSFAARAAIVRRIGAGAISATVAHEVTKTRRGTGTRLPGRQRRAALGADLRHSPGGM